MNSVFRPLAGRWIYPVDPDCPEVAEYMTSLFNDPMTAECGCVDDIVRGFESKHRCKCRRCQEYGAANVDVSYE